MVIGSWGRVTTRKVGSETSEKPEFEYDHVNHVTKSVPHGGGVVGEGYTVKKLLYTD